MQRSLTLEPFRSPSDASGSGATRTPGPRIERKDFAIEWPYESERPLDEMLSHVYDALHRIARGYMRSERRDHTLQPTALVHEAYLRLADQQRAGWTNRAQFVAIAAVMMRRILVNHARKRAAAKRDHGKRTSISLVADANLPPEVDVLSLHDALERLAAMDVRKARIVELKFFGGLTTGEICEVLQVSHATVERDWTFARAWLSGAIVGDAA
ncbi:MAG: ECF-type sigma factor [Vicinamibacteraceae bacterium]